MNGYAGGSSHTHYLVEGADFSNTRLEEVNLQGATFRQDWYMASFIKTKIIFADLPGANLSDLNFEGATLGGMTRDTGYSILDAKCEL